MKLSLILDRYYVIANSSVVGFHWPDETDGDTACSITFQDDDGMDVDQRFNDQDVQLLESPKGGFVVTDVDGEACQFTALDGVELNA